MDGHAGDECPAREDDYESWEHAGANEYEALPTDRLAGAYVDGVRRAGEGARVPKPHANEGAHGARSNASILQKSSAQAPARTEVRVSREAEPARE